MLQISFSYPFTIFFFFFFIVTPHDKTFISSSSAFSIDIINQTCKTCAAKSPIFNYNFCFTSLQTIPISHSTNIQGLALIAMELALENATDTISSIEMMLTSETFDPFVKSSLEDCLKLYSNGVLKLIDATEAFLSGKYGTAFVWLSSVLEESVTCEEGFTEKEGGGGEEVSPLTRENYDLFQLCDIALCIIQQVYGHSVENVNCIN